MADLLDSIRPPAGEVAPIRQCGRARDNPRQRFLDATALRDRAILELLYGSAIRVAELTGLTRDGLELGHKATVRVMGKGSVERIVPLSEPSVIALRRWLRKNPTGTLWPNARGKPMTTRDVRHMIERRAPGMRPHLFRHASATHFLDGGADLRVVQDFLGHSSATTTQRYAQVSRGRKFSVYGTSHPRA
jgi:integrase/recombinase XerC